MKTKALLKSFAFCLIAICSVCANAQISTNELPPSFSSSLFSTRSSDVINLPVPDVAEALHEDSLFADMKDIPYRIGLPITVNYTLENSGNWHVLGDSVRVWRLQLHVDKAKALSLNYDRFWLPEKAKLFVYSVDKTCCMGGFTDSNNKGAKDFPANFATGLVAGSDIILEYYEPINAIRGIISIDKVIYAYKDILTYSGNTKTLGFGDALSCNVNINCPEGDEWQKEKRAVACIYYDGYLCTGALINNTSGEDYFLTANHCFSNYDAQGNSQINQMIFYWNYESKDCSNGTNFNPPTSSGAKLVANNEYSDFALLKLVESVRDIPAYTPYYLGWARSSSFPTKGTVIHHPRGDIKKIAIDNNTLGNAVNNTHWKVTYDVGTTERGSSGAPLLNQNKLVVGQLHSGGIGCNISDNYGRFDVSWDHGSVATRRLKDWLDSNNTGITQLDARDLALEIIGAEYVCGNTVYYVQNLPINATVMWESSSSSFILQPNFPLVNQCTVTSETSALTSTTLKAMIIQNGDTIATVTKTIAIVSISLSGYYTQEACTFYNVSHPVIPVTGIRKAEPMFVHQGCTVHLTLYGNKGRKITYEVDGFTPLYWYYNGDMSVEFQLPYLSGGIPFRVKIDREGACSPVYLLFFSLSGNANIGSYSLKVTTLSEYTKQISLISTQSKSSCSALDWTIEAYNTSYGTKVLGVKKLVDSNYQLNTSGWTPGIYVIRVVAGTEILTEKITVGK